MVLIELPSARTAEPPITAPPVASSAHAQQAEAAGSATDFDDAAALLNAPSAAQNAPAPDPSELADTVEDLSLRMGDEALPARQTFAEPPHRQTQKEIEESPSAPADDATAEPAEATTHAAGEAATAPSPWRNRLLIAGAGTVGVALALCLALLLRGGNTPDASNSSSQQVAQSEIAPSGSVNQQDESTDPIPLEPSPPEAMTPSPADEPSGPGSQLSPPETAEEVVPLTAEPIVDPSPAELPAPEAVASALPPEAAPPGFVVESAEASSSATPGLRTVAETLRDFSSVLGGAATMPESTAETPEPERTVAEAEETAEVGSATRRPAPRIVEVDDRLNDPIVQIDFDGVPLERFLRFMSDYSTIPITLDADVLMWAKLSPATPVRVNQAETTVAEVLEEGLTPLGLYYRIEGDQLFVTRRAKEEGALRAVTFKVADLVGDDPERLQMLGELIIDLVEPDSWSSRGGEGTVTFQGNTLVIEQHEPVLFAVLGFCEKLRVARGLTTRSPYEPSAFRLESRYQRAAAKLAQPVSLTYLRPAPLTSILDRLSASASMHVLIDWRALARTGWNPDAETTYTVAGRPLAEALALLLTPMDLAFRAVDESIVEITTPQALESRLEIEFYRVGELLQATAEEEFIAAAQRSLGRELFQDAGGRGMLAIDRDSRCLIASLPQPRQMALQDWLVGRLDSLRSGATTPTATVAPR